MRTDMPRPRRGNSVADQRSRNLNAYADDFYLLLSQVRQSQARAEEDAKRARSEAKRLAAERVAEGGEMRVEYANRVQSSAVNTVPKGRFGPAWRDDWGAQLAANLFFDLLTVAFWPPILIAPIAWLGQFGTGSQIFIGTFDENVANLVLPFAVAAGVTIVCAWVVDIVRFARGFTAERALAGLVFLPPLCVVATPIAFIPFALVTEILTPLLPFLKVTDRMPLSNLMFWTSGLTPATLLLTYGISGKQEVDLHSALVVTVVVFLLSVLIS